MGGGDRADRDKISDVEPTQREIQAAAVRVPAARAKNKEVSEGVAWFYHKPCGNLPSMRSNLPGALNFRSKSLRCTAILFVFFPLSLAACQDAEPDCIESEQFISESEVTPLGLSVQTALTAAALQGAGQVKWQALEPNAAPTRMQWQVTPQIATARYIASRVNPDSRNDNVKICEPRIVMDAAIALVTEDGRLQEVSLPGVLEYRSVQGAPPAAAMWTMTEFSVPLSTLQGSLQQGLAPESGPKWQYGEWHLMVSGTSMFGGPNGVSMDVWRRAEGSEGGGDTPSYWERRILATFMADADNMLN